MLTIDLHKLLLNIARKSIKDGCYLNIKPKIDCTKWPEELQQPKATFITLHKDKNLRGCIGSLQPVRPLIEDVAFNAYSSAFSDYRFPKVQADELEQITIDISILTPRQQLDISSEEELLKKIRPNVDGLFIENSEYNATFLPSVWTDLKDPKVFLSQLKQKAGIPLNIWPQDMNCYVYQSEMIKERH